MHIDIFLSVISGLSITIITFLGWLTRLTVINGTKIDHLADKMDAHIKHLDEKINRQDNEARERIARLEKYFDVIMQTQIKKNGEQLKMET